MNVVERTSQDGFWVPVSGEIIFPDDSTPQEKNNKAADVSAGLRGLVESATESRRTSKREALNAQNASEQSIDNAVTAINGAEGYRGTNLFVEARAQAQGVLNRTHSAASSARDLRGEAKTARGIAARSRALAAIARDHAHTVRSDARTEREVAAGERLNDSITRDRVRAVHGNSERSQVDILRREADALWDEADEARQAADDAWGEADEARQAADNAWNAADASRTLLDKAWDLADEIIKDTFNTVQEANEKISAGEDPVLWEAMADEFNEAARQAIEQITQLKTDAFKAGKKARDKHADAKTAETKAERRENRARRAEEKAREKDNAAMGAGGGEVGALDEIPVEDLTPLYMDPEYEAHLALLELQRSQGEIYLKAMDVEYDSYSDKEAAITALIDAQAAESRRLLDSYEPRKQSHKELLDKLNRRLEEQRVAVLGRREKERAKIRKDVAEKAKEMAERIKKGEMPPGAESIMYKTDMGGFNEEIARLREELNSAQEELRFKPLRTIAEYRAQARQLAQMNVDYERKIRELEYEDDNKRIMKEELMRRLTGSGPPPTLSGSRTPPFSISPSGVMPSPPGVPPVTAQGTTAVAEVSADAERKVLADDEAMERYWDDKKRLEDVRDTGLDNLNREFGDKKYEIRSSHFSQADKDAALDSLNKDFKARESEILDTFNREDGILWNTHVSNTSKKAGESTGVGNLLKEISPEDEEIIRQGIVDVVKSVEQATDPSWKPKGLMPHVPEDEWHFLPDYKPGESVYEGLDEGDLQTTAESAATGGQTETGPTGGSPRKPADLRPSQVGTGMSGHTESTLHGQPGTGTPLATDTRRASGTGTGSMPLEQRLKKESKHSRQLMEDIKRKYYGESGELIGPTVTEHSDGRITTEYSGGGKETSFMDGTSEFVMPQQNGQISISRLPGPDNTVLISTTTTTMLEDGTMAFTTENPDGTYTLELYGPDGTYTKTVPNEDGGTTTRTTHPDGRVKEIKSGVPDAGPGTMVISNPDRGFTIINKNKDGSETRTTMGGDGSRSMTTWPDGKTSITTGILGDDGTEMFTTANPDGTRTVEAYGADGSYTIDVPNTDGTRTIDRTEPNGARTRKTVNQNGKTVALETKNSDGTWTSSAPDSQGGFTDGQARGVGTTPGRTSPVSSGPGSGATSSRASGSGQASSRTLPVGGPSDPSEIRDQGKIKDHPIDGSTGTSTSAPWRRQGPAPVTTESR